MDLPIVKIGHGRINLAQVMNWRLVRSEGYCYLRFYNPTWSMEIGSNELAILKALEEIDDAIRLGADIVEIDLPKS